MDLERDGMSKRNFLKDLASQLTAALPTHIGALKKDFEKNCHAVLLKAFEKFDLVTREEFDTQTKVLARTRKKLEELESHIEQLEAVLKKKKPK
jgi:BMFP domain-containing protein YqiC